MPGFSFGLGLGLSSGKATASGALLGAGTATGTIMDSLQSETDGLVFDGANNYLLIRDTGTPANEYYNTLPNAVTGAILTYSAPSTKYVRNSSGTLVAGTTLRTHYDTAATALGILIEEQRTNIILQSEDFSNASWSSEFSTITANSTTAPDGNATADTILETTDSQPHDRYQAVSGTSGTTYCFSVYVKDYVGSRFAALRIYKGSTDWFTYVFNPRTGAMTANSTGAGSTFTNISYGSSSEGNGWYRIWITATAGASVSLYPTVFLSDSATPTIAAGDGSILYAGTATNGLYLWGAVFEDGSYPSSYIPTTTVSVTRSADVISIATSKFPWSATNGYFAVTIRPDVANKLGGAVSVNDGTAANDITIYRDASGNIVEQVTHTSTAQLAPLDSLQNATNLTESGIAAKYAANDFAISVDGNTAQTDTLGSLPTVTNMQIGVDQAGNYIQGVIKTLKYVPRNPSSANLASESLFF